MSLAVYGVLRLLLWKQELSALSSKLNKKIYNVTPQIEINWADSFRFAKKYTEMMEGQATGWKNRLNFKKD